MVLGKNIDRVARIEDYGFNPCFDGWCSGRDSRSQLKGPGVDVSILVLMDGAREERCDRWKSPLNLCFNPCFDGWCSGSCYISNVRPSVPGFQSLF